MKIFAAISALCCVSAMWAAPLAVAETLPAPGTQAAQEFKSEGKTAKYWLWRPQQAPAEGAPLLLFLHGSGERGDDLAKVKRHGPVKLVETMPAVQPFILISPQCSAGERWDVDLLQALVQHVADTCKADRSRLYITGLSMGGYATWEITAKYPDLFAAAVPICGGGDPAKAEKMKHIPFRIFHGAKDEAVPLARSEEMETALKKARATDVKLTVFPDLAHDSWTPVYATADIYEWLLRQRKK